MNFPARPVGTVGHGADSANVMIHDGLHDDASLRMKTVLPMTRALS